MVRMGKQPSGIAKKINWLLILTIASLPIILGETNSVHDTLCWEHEGGKAAQVGDWKMSAMKKSPWKIFNIAKVRNEVINLACQFPEKGKELEVAWGKWAEKMKKYIR